MISQIFYIINLLFLRNLFSFSSLKLSKLKFSRLIAYWSPHKFNLEMKCKFNKLRGRRECIWEINCCFQQYSIFQCYTGCCYAESTENKNFRILPIMIRLKSLDIRISLTTNLLTSFHRKQRFPLAYHSLSFMTSKLEFSL